MKTAIEIVRDFDGTYYANITINDKEVPNLPVYVDYTTLKKAVLEVTGIVLPNVSTLKFQKMGRKKYATVHLPESQVAETDIPADADILAKLNQRFPGNDNYGQPKEKYFLNLLAMTPETLYQEAKDKIWLSAYANNNPRSDYHWQVDAIYDVCHARGQDDLYERAYRSTVYQATGRMP